MINHSLPTSQPQHEFPVYVCATICCSWHCAIESTACSHVSNKALCVSVFLYFSRHQDLYVFITCGFISNKFALSSVFAGCVTERLFCCYVNVSQNSPVFLLCF